MLSHPFHLSSGLSLIIEEPLKMVSLKSFNDFKQPKAASIPTMAIGGYWELGIGYWVLALKV